VKVEEGADDIVSGLTEIGPWPFQVDQAGSEGCALLGGSLAGSVERFLREIRGFDLVSPSEGEGVATRAAG